MLPKVSKGFRAIFVAVMCVVCVALCVLAVRLGWVSARWKRC